ncbi:putative elongation factor 1-gamma (ef-1-gamma) [Mrakia frigida]|uniref:putative elongation factor 1-gamma (ef-1-gamma) n=1 Tax=Mrakia frigida TaxID=29902 RepID=UPI003FCC0FD0
MSSDLILYTPKASSLKNHRILSVAAYAGVELSVPEFDPSKEGKDDEFLQKFPQGKAPALESVSKKLYLTETSAIAFYLASISPNSGLLLPDVEQRAKIVEWISFAESELILPLLDLRGLLDNEVPYFKPVYQITLDKTLAALSVLESYLTSHTFLVGDRITLADLTIGVALADGFSLIFGPEEQTKFSNALRFEQTIVNNPKIAHIYKDVALASTAVVYTPLKKESSKAPKQRVPKAPKAAATVVPKPKPAPEEEAEQSEEESFDRVKKASPLDLLPKSTFNLDEWKRTYSNKDTRAEAIPWLYENFQKDDFSIWRIDFKFNEELTLTFKSSNQITGFFTRLEGSRKYLFASLGVLGKPNDSIITGIAILRGKDPKVVFDVAPDFDSYDVKELDLEKKEDREFLEGALAWDLKVGDKEWVDGKVFK